MRHRFVPLYIILMVCLVMTTLLSGCRRHLGYGVLLWDLEELGIPAGTIAPVYVRSNIDKVWVIGIPKEYRRGDTAMAEIPLALLELCGSKGAAQKRAAAFSVYAATYAETAQDGLPIRADPDNGARRVYRLRAGEVIKILAEAKGNPAISASGAPLPGTWYQVLTKDGTRGYCFSYRLSLFQHSSGPLENAAVAGSALRDAELERALSAVWVAEEYDTMLNESRLNIDDLRQNWGFSPGEDTGIAHIFLPDDDLSFHYTGIKRDLASPQTWLFEGTPLSMRLRSETQLVVRWNDALGYEHSASFVNLPTSLDDLIAQETERRATLYTALFDEGPAFISAAYGELSFPGEGRFTWRGLESLIPQIIPAGVSVSGEGGIGSAEFRLFLTPALASRYTGALTFRFNTLASENAAVNFLYTLDTAAHSLRLEYVSAADIDKDVVARRAASPLVLFFYNDTVDL